MCSHDDGPVAEGELDGYEIECPRHGARFDVRSGKVLSFPAIVDIPAYEARVEDGEVQIAFPVEGGVGWKTVLEIVRLNSLPSGREFF